MSSTRLEYLFTKARQLKASENELTELHKMLDEPVYEKQVLRLMAAVIESPHHIKGIVDDRVSRETLQAIFSIDEERCEEEDRKQALFTSKKMNWYARPGFKYVIAASLVLTLIMFSWLQFSHKPGTVPGKSLSKADVQPGRNGAVLTLADGTLVMLDSIGDGMIARQPGAELVMKNGLLSYDHSGTAATEYALNTMTTPPGRQFQLQLPDGTKVWMNAASSITYPSQFNSTAREVTVTGEVYFEVAANRNIPFLVNIDKETQIQVTGTSFNVQAYANNFVKTTLLAGGVVIRYGAQQQQLRPGQQALIGKQGPIQLKQDVNTGQIMAWKNGLFDFTHQDIGTVMNEIGRWYDLRIVFEGNPVNIEIVGEIERSLSLQQLMNVLRRLGVKCRLEDRNLFVMH